MRLVLFGGSFDPVHRGHAAVADAARRALEPDLLLWIPARRAPHKPGRRPREPRIRGVLLEAFLHDRPGEALCSLELEREAPSYTIETVRALEAKHPGAELWFLIGSDSLEHLPTWKDLPGLLRSLHFGVVPRPGHPRERLEAFRSSLPPELRRAFRARWIPMQPVAVSSTEVRRRLARGEDCRDLLPAAVAERIEREGWYREGPA